MIFTRHAIERYRQFHLLDQPTATDEDARVALEANAGAAVRVPTRTHRGDEVWTIHALGVELVVKRDGDFEEPVCVTVLPPTRFRGLTPLQAERVEDAAREATARAEEARTRHEVAQAELAAATERLKEANRQAASARQAAAQAEAIGRKADAAQAHRDHAERLRQAKNEATSVFAERDILMSTLKTMRVQMTVERDADVLRAALRIAVRALRDTGATEALVAIDAIDPGLASEAFANRGREP